MTVCVTGDVHHMGMDTRDQQYLDGSEVEAAIEYAEIAASHDVPVTLFCTGKGVKEAPGAMRRLAGMETVELGGHNYWAFTTPVHSAWRALEMVTGGRIGSWNGPSPFQGYEVQKTVDAFADLGVDLTAWRDHAYRHDENTAMLLAERGFTHFSDAVGPDKRVRNERGLTTVPINTPPDHEHVYHGFRTPDFVAANGFAGPFGEQSREVEAWVEWVLEAIEERLADGQPATVLAHPACMQLADGFDAFEHLCERIGTAYKPARISEVDVDGQA